VPGLPLPQAIAYRLCSNYSRNTMEPEPKRTRSSLQPVRGTHDLLPGRRGASPRCRGECERDVALRYGYSEIGDPDLRVLGRVRRCARRHFRRRDMEMYTFTTIGGEEVTLSRRAPRGVARCSNLQRPRLDLPLKFFYAGPMFRYERRRRGGSGIFHQIGIELIGVAQPLADSK
jgi:histidyl-tRNA synthetase